MSIKKKVVLVVSNPVIKDARVLKEAESLTSQDFEVVVYGTKDKDLPPVERLNGFTIKRLSVQTYSLRLRPLRFFSEFLPALYALINEEANIYHANDLDTLFISYLASLNNKAKLIYDSHELWSDRREVLEKAGFWTKVHFRFKLFQEKILVKKVDLVITVSDSIASYLEKHYKIQKPIVIKNCPKILVKRKQDFFREKFGLENKKIVLY